MRNLRRLVCMWTVKFACCCPVYMVAVAAGPYHGNVQSGFISSSSCRYYFLKRCTAVFATVQAAQAAGYWPTRLRG